MSWRSQLIVRVFAFAAVVALPAGCSDPYDHGAGVNSSATSSSAASATTTAATGAGISPPSGASSTPTAPTTPDLDQSARAGVGPSSADLRAAAQAARVFVGPYLLYTYGRAKASRIPAADPSLIGQLVANPPSVPPSVRLRTPRVKSLSVSGGQAGQVAYEAVVSDGTDTYAVPLTVTHEQNRWLVTSVQ
jgi:hypothetical protein